MRNYLRLLLTALIPALTLSAAVTTAHARRIELSNTRIRLVWASFELVGVFEVAVRCSSLTLEGTIHSRTFSKVSGQLLGYITSAALKRPCTSAEAWVLNGTEQLPNGTKPTSLPWHILFVSFTGVLPRISAIRLSLRGFGFLISSFGTGCLYLTTNAHPLIGELSANETTGDVNEFRPDETASIPPFAILEGFCESARFRGAATVTVQGSTTTKIKVRLVQ
jgi:hypothetical protein